MGFKSFSATALVVFATILYIGYAADVKCITETCTTKDNIKECISNVNPEVCKNSVCLDLEGKAQDTDLGSTVDFTLQTCINETITCEAIKDHSQSMEAWKLKEIDATSCRTCDGDNCNGAYALHTTMAVFMVPIIVLISKSIL